MEKQEGDVCVFVDGEGEGGGAEKYKRILCFESGLIRSTVAQKGQTQTFYNTQI